MPVSLVSKEPVAVTEGVVLITSALAASAGYTVNVMLAVVHGAGNRLHSVYVADVVPVKPVAGV